jgi:hypothetical protein
VPDIGRYAAERKGSLGGGSGVVLLVVLGGAGMEKEGHVIGTLGDKRRGKSGDSASDG